jgi:hypothetical protein
MKKTSKRSRLARWLLGTWLLVSSVLYLVALLASFPEIGSGSNGESGWVFACGAIGRLCAALPPVGPERGFLRLAMLGGALGASLHALQSFSAFVGNRSLRISWAWWYLMRAPIGATLGALFYVVARGGLTPGATDGVSPYGVLAFAGLAGLFSMKATQKLRDVFDAMFRPRDEDGDKLGSSVLRIDALVPAALPSTGGVVRVRVEGRGFSEQCVAELDGVEVATEFLSDGALIAVLDPQGRAAGSEGELIIVEAGPPERRSEAATVSFT